MQHLITRNLHCTSYSNVKVIGYNCNNLDIVFYPFLKGGEGDGVKRGKMATNANKAPKR